jgi:hypothetical protein
MRETVALGFLEVTRKGRAGNAEHRAPNLFRLTYRPSDGVQGDGSHEWRRIKSAEEAEEIASAARKAKSKKKTKNQCRKMPVFGAKNRHRKPDFPVPKTGTKEMAKTGTTSISRDIPPEQSAGEARPSQGAVASRPMATNPLPPAVSERADILLSRVVGRLGSGEVGWLIVQAATEPELDNLIALEARGALDAAPLAAMRLKYRRGAA